MHTIHRSTSLLIWCLAVLMILSCNAVTKVFEPIPVVTATTTSSPTASATSLPTITPTPTLGIQGGWQNGVIAFASNRTGTFQIYTMQPDGSRLMQLTASKGDNRSPTWSGDGKRLFFQSTRDGNSEIYMMNPDGSEQQNLTRDPGQDTMPIWVPMPPGKVAFISDRTGLERVFIMNMDGSAVQSFGNTGLSRTMSFLCLSSLGGPLIAFSVQNGLWRLTRILDISDSSLVDPTVLNRRTQRSCLVIAQVGSDPDMLFISNRGGEDQIYRWNYYDDYEVQLTSGPLPSIDPSPSSDHNWIAFASRRTGNWDIHVMDRQGRNQWNITNDPATDLGPVWQPRLGSSQPLVRLSNP